MHTLVLPRRQMLDLDTDARSEIADLNAARKEYDLYQQQEARRVLREAKREIQTAVLGVREKLRNTNPELLRHMPPSVRRLIKVAS